MSEHGDIIHAESYSDEHPAYYDQKLAQATEILGRSKGYILYALELDDGEEVDGVKIRKGVGHVFVGRRPGIELPRFLVDGLSAIGETLEEVLDQMEGEDDGEGSETEG